MSQICLTPKTEHEPQIERYYDELQPTLVMRIWRCNLCGALLEKDVVDKRTDPDEDDYDPSYVEPVEQDQRPE